MKTKHIYLLLSLFTIILFACGPETKEEKLDNYIEAGDNAKNKSIYTNPIEFSDAIVGLDTKIIIEMIKFHPMEDVDEMTKQLSVLQKEILSAIEILEKISCPKDKNNKFKNASLSMFNLYDSWADAWSSFLDEMDNENIDNFLDYNENISETLNNKLYNVSELEFELQSNNSWISAQEDFSKEAGFMISTEEHPLDEEIDNL